MNPILMSLVLFVGLTSFSILAGGRLRLLGILSPENRFDQIGRRIKTLLTMGVGQKKFLTRKKEKSSAIMHVCIFWGFLILMTRTLTLIGEGFVEGFHFPFLGDDYFIGYAYIFVKDIVEVIVLTAVAYALYRRLVLNVKRLYNTPHAYFILFMEAMVVLTDLIFDGARINIVRHFGNPDHIHIFNNPVFGEEWLWAPASSLFAYLLLTENYLPQALLMQTFYWAHILTILVFLCYLPMNKHFHVIVGLPNTFFAMLGFPHKQIDLLDLENEKSWENESLGINHLHQLTWKQGLDLMSCTECGRCQDVCPTYVTQKPLALKTFNDDLKNALFDHQNSYLEMGALQKKQKRSKDKKEQEELQQKINALRHPKKLIGEIIQPETLWACTTCRACEEVCPLGIEHVPRTIAMRQGQTLMEEAYPAELNTAYKGLERNGNPWGLGYDQRTEWAKDLNLEVFSNNADAEYLLWVGCAGAYDNQGQKTAQATAKLLQKAGVSFAILGNEEKCTGDFARRTGNEMMYQMMAQENIETMNGYGIKKIITTCPHCANSLGNEYKELGGDYEVAHHTEILSDLLQEGKIKVAEQNQKKITYHDPCYLGRYKGVYKQPRQILSKLSGGKVIEMERSGSESFCCGAGGGRIWMEENIGKRINIERVDEAASTNAEIVAVGCPFCKTMIDDGIKGTDRDKQMETKDIAELLWEANE